MEFLSAILAVACSFIAYFIEKSMWMTIVSTTDKAAYKEWRQRLDEIGVAYHVKKTITLENDNLKRKYKIKIHVREAAKVDITR
ncbi:hypothetical protein [Brevibacillus dissolubilis]|uniref:hypothetical protein n=1 Tax=Brevibacillus dissolubilis TaxID=1844116 RepID=UPI0011168D64|nr:hypothetical protein [Brevibacillus dissolubilis]